jgi:hypothetical protein
LVWVVASRFVARSLTGRERSERCVCGVRNDRSVAHRFKAFFLNGHGSIFFIYLPILYNTVMPNNIWPLQKFLGTV